MSGAGDRIRERRRDHRTSAAPARSSVTPANENDAPSLSERETKVLRALAEIYNDYDGGGFMGFKSIASITGIERPRRYARSLKRKGLAEFCSGLMNDDGEFAGAGYGCTKRGYEIAAALDLDDQD